MNPLFLLSLGLGAALLLTPSAVSSKQSAPDKVEIAPLISFSSGLKALPRFQNVSSDQKAPLVIVLHGRGGYEKALLSTIPTNFSARVFFLRGQLKNPAGGYLFYNRRLKENSPELAEEIIDASTDVMSAINYLVNEYPTSKVIIFGFSQGAAISLYIGSIGESSSSIGFSGALPKYLFPEQSQPSKIFIFHGTNDAVVSEKLDGETAKAFEKQGFDVSYKTRTVGHVLPPKDLVKEYFNEALK